MTYSRFDIFRCLTVFISLALFLLCQPALAEKSIPIHPSEASLPPVSSSCEQPPYSVSSTTNAENAVIDCRKGKWCWGVSNNQCVDGYYYRECCCKFKCSNKKLERKPCSGDGGWELVDSKEVVPCSNSCSGPNPDGSTWFHNCSAGDCQYGCLRGTCNKVTCNVSCAPAPPPVPLPVGSNDTKDKSTKKSNVIK